MYLTTEEWHARYRQQARWTESIRRYLFSKINIQSARRILEVGSGTGAITGDFSAACEASIFGLDIDIKSLQFARGVDPATHICLGDGNQIPFAKHSFDITACHYLLLWIEDPARVLREMGRVTRAGGFVLALAEPDYEARIDFPDSLSKIGQLQTQALKAQGAHTNIGRKLAALMTQAGLKPVECGVLGGQWTYSGIPEGWEMEWKVLEADIGAGTNPEQIHKLRNEDREKYLARERILYVPTFYALGLASDTETFPL